MHRFYFRTEQISQNVIRISDKAQLHHIRDVLRYKKSDEIHMFDEKGNEYRGVIKDMNKNAATIAVTQQKKSESLQGRFITIACAIPKRTKMEDIIDKLTQLGISRIIPMITERVLVRLDPHKKTAKLSRWQKVSVQACQQSQRKQLPVVGPVLTFDEVMRETQFYELKLIPTLEGARKGIREIMRDTKAESIAVLIGPEGDFTPREIKMAVDNGFIPVTLGDLVLRVDTAAICAASILGSGLDI